MRRVDSFQKKSYNEQRTQAAFELAIFIAFVYYLSGYVDKGHLALSVNEPGHTANIAHSSALLSIQHG